MNLLILNLLLVRNMCTVVELVVLFYWLSKWILIKQMIDLKGKGTVQSSSLFCLLLLALFVLLVVLIGLFVLDLFDLICWLFELNFDQNPLFWILFSLAFYFLRSDK